MSAKQLRAQAAASRARGLECEQTGSQSVASLHLLRSCELYRQAETLEHDARERHATVLAWVAVAVAGVLSAAVFMLGM